MEALKKVVEGKSSPQSPRTPPDAVFASAHASLMFAFNFTHGTLKRPMIWQVKPSRDGKGLAGLDGAAQAGMIRAELGCLSPVRQRIIEARFAPRSSPCSCKAPCCSGSRDTSEWKEAVDWLTEYVLVQGLTGNISHHRLRRSVVKRYFWWKESGVKESFVEMAAACKINRDTACDLNKRVAECFRAEEDKAMAEIEARLRKAGIVG